MRLDEQDRYSRQILFHPIGEAGQEKIGRASIAIVGCGALGSFQADILARAGVGRLVLIDRDTVELSNLQRQLLFAEEDAAAELPKAEAAAKRLRAINHNVHVDTHVADLTPSNGEELLAGCDVIVDGTDNFETRYLLNDISVKSGVPWIYGAAIGSYGITMPIVPGRGPCFSCLYPQAPAGLQPTCDVDGVLASITATVAAAQSAMVLRLLTGWAGFRSYLQSFDVWEGTSRRLDAGDADAACPTCGLRQFLYLHSRKRAPVSLCGRNAVQLHDRTRPLDLIELATRLKPLGTIRMNDFALRMAMPPYEVTFFPDGRAIVKGTTDLGVARSVYARLIGV